MTDVMARNADNMVEPDEEELTREQVLDLVERMRQIVVQLEHVGVIEPEKPTRAELLTLVEKMQGDWVTLNEFLNVTAKRYSWCSDYEERLNHYNGDFDVLKLYGRDPQDHGSNRDNHIVPGLRRIRPTREDV